MITGDNKDTAIAIAKECGILDSSYNDGNNDYTVLTGREFRGLVGDLIDDCKKTNQEVDSRKFNVLTEVAKNLKVLARVHPEDKYILVTQLKQLNEVVAVVGDGTNDTLALKCSNVGISLQIAGTQIAQDASSILLQDDNIESVVEAVKWGRHIYKNVRKFIQYQLTMSIVVLTLCFVGVCTIKIVPLSALQLLWVSLAMNILVAVAFGTELARDELLDKVPVKSENSLVTPKMMKLVVGRSIYQSVCLLAMLFLIGWSSQGYSEENTKLLTLIFNTFVFLQIFNAMNCRKLNLFETNVFKDLSNNWVFSAIIIFIVVVQVLMVSFGGKALNVTSLKPQEHALCILIGAGGLICDTFARLLPTSVFKYLRVSEEVPRSIFLSFVRRRSIINSLRAFR